MIEESTATATPTIVLAQGGMVGNVQNVHPLGATAAALLCLLLIVGRPRVSVFALLVAAMCLPSAQRVVIGGADLPLVRLLAIVSMMRLLFSGSIGLLRWNIVDLCVVGGALARAAGALVTLGGPPAVVTSIGASIDTVGVYFVTRAALRSRDDIVWLARATLLCALPIAVVFAIESSTGRNMMSVFGGVPAITDIREGRLRCQGAFSHPILAGCFFTALAPLWISQLRWHGGRIVCWGGVAVTAVVVFCCASSTPLVALVVTAGALLAYRAWASLRLILMLSIAAAVLLHFLMERGVWHLIARIDLVGGSTGYHRYNLIDKAIKNIDEWWLFGTASTAHWGYGLFDVTNQYVLEGTRGGIWATLALLGAIVFSMAGVGRALRRWPQAAAEHWMAYCAGVSIFAQAFIFLAVSYFGQTVIIWPVTLAIALLWGELAVEPRRAAATVSEDRPSSAARQALVRVEAEPLPVLRSDGAKGGDVG